MSRKSNSSDRNETGVPVLLGLMVPFAGLVGRECLEDVDAERGEDLSSERLENRFKNRETAEGPDVAESNGNFASAVEVGVADVISCTIGEEILSLTGLNSPVIHDCMENLDDMGER